ncbi:hypothetical protein [Actinomadura flavalba]|uniref:hypothetical protein n=1 Tax=Actinomadura flavalba TaxID=1120938 RepID=UPI00036BAD39|nr:hypothetical protein [Actinomadura flavalba]
MSDALLLAISLGVTALGLVLSWAVARRRGAASGLRGAAWALVPTAATLTGVTEFLVDLAFSPVKWAGVGVAGLAVLLYLTSGAMLSRKVTAAEEGGGAPPKETRGRARGGDRAVERPAGRSGSGGGDPEMAEIEAILRNRGIN